MYSEIVTMIRKHHNHKLQTNPWHRKEKPHNNHKTPGRQTKQCNQLSLPHQDDCKNILDMGRPIAYSVACLALTSWIPLPRRFGSR